MLKRISEYDYSALSSTDRIWMLARNPYSRVLSLYLHKVVGLCKFGSLGCKDHAERMKFAGILGYNASAPPAFSVWVDLLARVMVRLQVRARRKLPAVPSGNDDKQGFSEGVILLERAQRQCRKPARA